jgi:hypothetical protein
MTMDKASRLIEQFKRGPIIHVVDDTNSSLNHLRTVSLLKFLGHHDFTYSWGWRACSENGSNCNSIVAHEYHHIKAILDSIDLKRKLCTITLSPIEKKNYSVQLLVQRYVENNESSLVLITDKDNFTLLGAYRPLRDENFTSGSFRFDEILGTVTDSIEHQFRFDGINSKSLYVWRNAVMYYLVEGVSSNYVANCPSVWKDAPYLPIWWDMSRLSHFSGKVDYFDLSTIQNAVEKELDFPKSVARQLVYEAFENEEKYLNQHVLIKRCREGFLEGLENFLGIMPTLPVVHRKWLDDDIARAERITGGS